MNVSKINIGKEEFPLVMSMSAIEEILEAFGSMDEMTKRMDSDDTLVQLKTIDRLLVILINAGIRYCKAVGLPTPEELAFDPADVLDIQSQEIITSIKGAMISSQKTTIKAKPPKNSKNAQTPAEE